MPTAISHIGTVVLTSAQASVVFPSIPQGYRDLRLVVNASDTVATNDFYPFYFRINGDTAANYFFVYMRAYGTTVDSSYTGSGSTSGRLGHIVANTFANAGSAVADFLDYSATDKQKSVLCRSNVPIGSASTVVDAYANRWASNTAVTSITIISNATFTAGSTFSLYGVAA